MKRVDRALLAGAMVCLAAVVLRNLGVVSPVLPQVWDKAYNGVEFLAIAVCGLRALRSRAGERLAWGAFTLGLLGFALGDVYYTVALTGAAEPPYPSWADAGYLSIYPGVYVGLVLLLRARAPRLGKALWLDGLVCALAGAALGAALVFGVVASTDGSFATVATNLAYPLGDLMMLALVIAVMVVTGRKAGSTWWVLAIAFALLAAADSTYLYQIALGTYREYTILDAAWPATYLLVALAACRPAERLDARRLRGRMLALPAAFALLALGLLVVDHYTRLNGLAVWLATAALGAAITRFALTFRENLRTLGASETEAATDDLTGLGNRRALLADLEHLASEATPERPVMLALFDLDGFKAYNDSFGHPAGDALLARLGRDLEAAVAGAGSAYRMGGDEFCVLAAGGDHAELLDQASEALSASGDRFAIASSRGAVFLTGEDDLPADALRIADQRMYAHKHGGRRTSDEIVYQALLSVAAEQDGVAELAEAVGNELGLKATELLELRRAAELHDIGKVALPDSILNTPRPLDESEWEYIRQHTIIGERIISAAPELLGVARVVRASHERIDGGGYPDGLSGEEIPLGARIIAVCDAYRAMVTPRAYRPARSPRAALDELTRCAGSQFDPRVVIAFKAVLMAVAVAGR